MLSGLSLLVGVAVAVAPVPPPSAALHVGFMDTEAPPAGWTVSPVSRGYRVAAPEGDLIIILIAAPNGSSPEQARALVRPLAPECPYREATTQEFPGRRGAERSIVTNYDVPESANRDMSVSVVQKGDERVVALTCGSHSTFEKRAAELSLFTNSIHARGWKDENFVGKTPNHWTPERVAMLRTFLTSAMKQLRVPGIGWAVIDHGRIADEGGLGVRSLATRAPVDAHTRFMIVSNTKGLTTLLLARQVGEGKVRWDTKVATIDPAIRLADPETSKKLTVRDLICACTGLPRADYETYFVGPAADSRLVLGQLAALKPTTAFGETFQYSNTLAATAGVVAGRIAYPRMEPLAAFDRALKEQVLNPLGMRDTDFPDPRRITGNMADGYGDALDGSIAQVPQGLNATLLPFRPTGAAFSSAHDLALFAANELNEGKLADGQQWIDRAALLERRRRGVPISRDYWYGMGLMIRQFGGIDFLFHGGDANGYHAQWVVVPGTGLGAVMLTNGNNASGLKNLFISRVIEILYDAEKRAESSLAANAKQVDLALSDERAKTKPALPAAKILAAHYFHPLLGKIDVAQAAGQVIFDFGVWATPVGVKDDPGALGGKTFVSIAPSTIGDMAFVPGKEASGIRTLTLSDAQHSYVYREVSAPSPAPATRPVPERGH